MFVEAIDLFRAKFLKMTLQSSFLKSLFLSRAQRLLFLGTLALAFYFSATLFFPLWVLVIGPIIWGIPHIFSSFRYNTIQFEREDKHALIKLLSFIWLFVFAYRFTVDVVRFPLPFSQHYLFIEGLSLLVSFLVFIFYSKLKIVLQLMYLFFFGSLLLVTHFHPLETGLFLLIGHNYFPLINWYKSCQNKNDVKTFSILSIVYVFISLGIISGGFDSLYHFLSRQSEISFLNWNFLDIVSPFGATAETAHFWYRVVVLYAFSQSIHYFIWLKAIPENFHKSEFPPSFGSSWNKLKEDFGQPGVVLLLVAVTIGLLFWFFFEYQTARYIYFGVASYHGFLELSALPLFGTKKP